jgi:hypothetical protein
MRFPRVVTIGSGNRTWRVIVLTHPLSEFLGAYQRVTRERPAAPLPAGLWNVDTRTIHLRGDRNDEQRLTDLKHELHHAWIDWLDWAFPDPRG